MFYVSNGYHVFLCNVCHCMSDLWTSSNKNDCLIIPQDLPIVHSQMKPHFMQSDKNGGKMSMRILSLFYWHSLSPGFRLDLTGACICFQKWAINKLTEIDIVKKQANPDK